MTISAPRRPPGPDDPEALIEEAWQQAHRRRRRRIRIALLAVGVLALGVAVAIGSTDGGRSTSRGDRSSGAAGDRPSLRPVRYWYTRTIARAGAAIGVAVPSGRAIVETWIGTDGTWRQRVTDSSDPTVSSDTIIGGDGRFPPQADATGSYDGVPFNARDPGDGLFTYRQLQLLPTNVAGLRRRIEGAVAAQTDRNLNAYALPGKHHRQIVARLRPRYFGGAAGQTGQVLMAISDLEASPLPSRLRAALFGVAKSLPGVRATASAGDVVAQGPVNSLTAVPEHVAAIAEPAGLQPPQLAITPRSGRPGTTFTIQLTTLATTARSHHAPALDANMFGPTGPGCVYWTSRPPVARLPPGRAATRAGTVTYTYQLSAGAIGRSAWCTGRYQLLISPIWQSLARGQPGTVNQLSHAAAYFTIR